MAGFRRHSGNRASVSRPARRGRPDCGRRLPRNCARSRATVRVQIRAAGRLVVQDVPIEDYVAAAILAEFDPPDADERGRASACSRSRRCRPHLCRVESAPPCARRLRLCATTHCQLVRPRAAAHVALGRRQAREASGGPTATALICRQRGASGLPRRLRRRTPAAPPPSGAGRRRHTGHPTGSDAGPEIPPWTSSTTLAPLPALNADPRTAVGRSVSTD